MKKYLLFSVLYLVICQHVLAQGKLITVPQTPTLLPLGTSEEMRKNLAPPPQDNDSPPSVVPQLTSAHDAVFVVGTARQRALQLANGAIDFGSQYKKRPGGRFGLLG